MRTAHFGSHTSKKRDINAISDASIRKYPQKFFLFLGLHIKVNVFILQLYHYDTLLTRLLTSELFLTKYPANSIVPMLRPFHVLRMVAPKPETGIIAVRAKFGKPARISTTGPLGTNKRTGTNNGIQSELFMCHMQPCFQIIKIALRIVVHTLRHIPFMPIPGDIGFHSIESGFFYLPEAVTPQFLRATEVMERSTEYKNILSFDSKTIFIIFHPVGMEKLLLRQGLCLHSEMYYHS